MPMIDQASFTLRGRNPDVLTCIANLSNDEVFTPPEFANRMLDTLAEAGATNHGGADLWADKSVKFLDPCTKSGVFLREIIRRLTDGLEKQIPNLQKPVDHILTKQVFGIGITLQDVITKIEPELFVTVTGLTVKDFHLAACRAWASDSQPRSMPTAAPAGRPDCGPYSRITRSACVWVTPLKSSVGCCCRPAGKSTMPSEFGRRRDGRDWPPG